MDDKQDGRDVHSGNGQDDGQQPAADPGLSLHMKLGGAGDPVEPDYSTQGGSGRLPESDEQVDPGVALHMRLGGAGDPVRSDYMTPDEPEAGAPAKVEGSRLCPGCNTITEFSGGICPDCGFQYSASSSGRPPDFAPGPAIDAPGSSQIMKILLIVVLVAVLAFAISRIDFSSLGGSEKQTVVEAEIEAPFIAVSIDDEFYASLSETLRDKTDAWTATGVDAYVYRYRVESKVEPGVSQYIKLTGFVGGPAAQEAIIAPADQPLRIALASYLQSYRDRTGLNYDLVLRATDGQEEILEGDHYVRFGLYYGREHMDEVKQVSSAIASYREQNGQYPRSLAGVSANMKLENRGFSFMPGGWGYLPIFATDSGGNVPFGSGSSSAELYPREVKGYYLVHFLSNPDLGVDLLSDEGKTYYLNRISPLPCVQKGSLRNVEITPDGEPDGIAWAVKNGELLDI